MDDQNKNLILATALSFLVILVWFVVFPPPEPTPAQDSVAAEQSGSSEAIAAAPTAAATGQTSTEAAAAEPEEPDAPRIPIETDRLSGSLSLLGGRIDDLSLRDYRVKNEPGSDIVRMLSPVGSDSAYYALYGWAPGGSLTPEDVPGANTLWSVESGTTLSAGAPWPWFGKTTRTWSSAASSRLTKTSCSPSPNLSKTPQAVMPALHHTGFWPATANHRI